MSHAGRWGGGGGTLQPCKLKSEIIITRNPISALNHKLPGRGGSVCHTESPVTNRKLGNLPGIPEGLNHRNSSVFTSRCYVSSTRCPSRHDTSAGLSFHINCGSHHLLQVETTADVKRLRRERFLSFRTNFLLLHDILNHILV